MPAHTAGISDEAGFDLVVLGSGAAGLAAALVGGVHGARVLLAEKAEVIGGTTAMSGGCTWVPANHHMLAAGLSDSADDALRYIRAVAPPGWAEVEEPLWQAFVAQAPAMLAFVEQHSASAASPTRTPTRPVRGCAAATCRRGRCASRGSGRGGGASGPRRCRTA